MPCLLYDGKGLVKTVKFKNPSYVGDPINAIRIFNEKEVDELILIDINATREKRRIDMARIAGFAGECFMPFAYGGGVKTVDDFYNLYKNGVEKVIVNSLVFENPEVIKEAVMKYGTQAVVACMDFKKNLFGKKNVYSYNGRTISLSPSDYVKYVEQDLGVGELFLNNVDAEGTWEGFDYDFVKQMASATTLPVIACGGGGTIGHLKKVLYESNANAAAIGSMSVYSKKGMGVLINFPSRASVIAE
ncbi:MAG: HisA/HisF-related TIM barrel protein [Bacteroidia bacterium]